MEQLPSQTETFIEALQEWKDSTSHTHINDNDTILFMLCNKIGTRAENDFLTNLRKRMDYLVKDQRIHEDVLINGLVDFVSGFLENTVKRHGDQILFHEKVLEDNEHIDASERILKRLRSPGYITMAEYELEVWQKIIAIKMSHSNKKLWEHQRMSKMTEKVDAMFGQINKEVLEVFSDVSMGELKDHVSFTELANLSVEDAKELRKKIKG